MSEIKYGYFSKSAVLVSNEHPSDQKKCYKLFLYTFSLRIRSRKNARQWNARKFSIKEDFKQNGSLSIS